MSKKIKQRGNFKLPDYYINGKPLILLRLKKRWTDDK